MLTNTRTFFAVAVAVETQRNVRQRITNTQPDTVQSQLIFPGISQSNTRLMPTTQTAPPIVGHRQAFSELRASLQRLQDATSNCLELFPQTPLDNVENLPAENEDFQEALDRLFQRVGDFCMCVLTTLSRYLLERVENDPSAALKVGLSAAIGITLAYGVFAPTTFVSGVFNTLANFGIPAYLLIGAGKAVCDRLGISVTQGARLSQVVAYSAGAMAFIEAVCMVVEAITKYISGNSSDISIDDRVNNPDVQEVTNLAVEYSVGQQLPASVQSINQTTTTQVPQASTSPQYPSSSSSANAMPQVSSNQFVFQPAPSPHQGRNIENSNFSFSLGNC